LRGEPRSEVGLPAPGLPAEGAHLAQSDQYASHVNSNEGLAGAMQLRPNVRLAEAIRSLKETVQALDTDLRNVHNEGSHDRYLERVRHTEGVLRNLFVDLDLVEALHSERYWHIRRYWENRPTAYISTADEGKWQRADSQSVYQIEAELRVQLERLKDTLAHLELFVPLSGSDAWPLVLDTNVLVHFDPFREEVTRAKWREIAQLPESPDVRLIVPALVLDELDQLAHSGDRNLNRRARQAQANLDPFVDHLLSDRPKAIRPADPWMTVEILPDAPNHRRQADNDTELLERADFLHQVTNTRVTFVTADRGMRVRGRVRQLLPAPSKVKMVAMPEELRVPDPPQATRGRSSSPRGSLEGPEASAPRREG
jgi:hypothetical protein